MTYVLSVGRLGVQLMASLIIARLIGPESYGIAAYVLLFASFAELLKESGLSAPLVSGRSLTRADARSAMASGLSIGLCAGAASAAITATAGLLTGVEPYVQLGLIAAVTFPIAGVTGVATALLVRDFRTTTLGAVEAGAAVLSIAIGITLATVGAGPASLVLQAVCYSILLCIGAWLSRPMRLLTAPQRMSAGRARGAGFRIAAAQFINNAFGSIDRIALGSIGTPAQIGAYAQAYQLFAVPLQFLSAPAQRIAVPSLGASHRDGGDLAQVYVATVRRLALVVWPLFAILCVVAPLLVQVVLGPVWAETAIVLRVLSLAACAQLLGYVTGWIFLATGQASSQLRWTVWSRPLVAAAVFAGLPWGATGVAWGVAIASILLVVPGYLYCARALDLSLHDLFSATTWPMMCALAGGIAAWIAFKAADILEGNDLLVLLSATAVGSTAALLASLAVPVLRRDLIAIFSALSHRGVAAPLPT
ncbi:oligosaccharide flippase family protein [Agromyces bauzanensis]